MSYLRVEFHVFHPSPSPESGKGFLAAGFLLRRNRAIRLLPVRDFCSGAYSRSFHCARRWFGLHLDIIGWGNRFCRPCHEGQSTKAAEAVSAERADLVQEKESRPSFWAGRLRVAIRCPNGRDGHALSKPTTGSSKGSAPRIVVTSDARSVTRRPAGSARRLFVGL